MPNMGSNTSGSRQSKAANDQESLRIFKDLIKSRFRQARSDEEENDGEDSDEFSQDDDESMESSQISADISDENQLAMNVDESAEEAQNN